MGASSLDQLIADVRYAVRVFRSRPLVTAVILLTLALGIGVNAAIFSFVDAILLKPLPYPNADRIVGLFERRPTGEPNAMSTLNYLDYARRDSVFEQIAATTVCCEAAMLDTDAGLQPLASLKVSASYFDVLGVKPQFGRTFAAGEDQPGSHHVVVLSHRIWASRFGSDPGLVGRTIQLDDQPHMVIGVMPADSPFDRTFVEIWVPVVFDAKRMNRASHWLLSISGGALGRLRPGVTVERARAELTAAARAISDAYPATNKGWGIVVEPYARLVVGPELRRSLYLLFAAVGMVLLIAIVNVANVLLAWAVARHREVAVRLALGASTARLVRQFLTEGLSIGIIGGLLGIGVGYGTLAMLKATVAALPLNLGMLPVLIPAEATIRLDWRVLTFVLALSAACSVAFALAPALAAAGEMRAGLMSGGGRMTGSAAHRRFRNALIGAQIALAFVLLTNAALLTRSFLAMRSADLGFDGANVVAVQMSRAANHFPSSPAFRTFMGEAAARIRALPGVSDVAFVDGMPMQGAPRMTFVQNADAPILERAQRPVADFKNVGADYFRVLRLRLRQGRALRDDDRATAPLVAVINETMARTFFEGADALGKRLLMDAPVLGDIYNGETAALTVVGVVSDEQLTPVDDRRERPVMYVSNQQYPTDFAGVLVRSSVPAARMEQPIRAAVAEVDKGVAVAHVWPVDQLESESRLPARLRSALLSVFAALALALSALGIYGVMSYSVVQRTHEIGVRTALGAQAGTVTAMVVWQGMKWALLGVAAGGVASVWLTRLLRSFLFGVGASDATSWLGALVTLLMVAILACYIPARTAARIDPLDALRAP